MNDLVNLQARLMCYGVRLDDPIRDDMTSADQVERGFIHGTVMIIAGHMIVNTSVLDTAYSEDSRAVALKRSNGVYFMEYQGRRYIVQFLPKPPFANQSFANGRVSDYLQLHNNETLFATPVRECAYIAAKRPCLFCTFENGHVRRLTEVQFTQLLERYIEWKSSIRAVAFGGGSPNLRDFGASYYTRLAFAARQVDSALQVSVEIVPARKDADWRTMLRSGAIDSIISSIEIWDDEIRAQVCLGKRELSKSHYFERWTTAIQELGRGRVSSVLLVGLEPLDSTLEGAKALIDAGVIPTLIPYRPYDASPLGARKAVDHVDYVRLSTKVAYLLRGSNLSPSEQPGCTACGACSLERTLTAPEHSLPLTPRSGA